MHTILRIFVCLFLFCGIYARNIFEIEDHVRTSHRSKRSIAQFALLVTCKLGSANGLKFNGYGCWCGIGGKGDPVDEIDQCCKTHDKCYSSVKKSGCKYWNHPYVKSYKFKCNNSYKCSDNNSGCARKACECDLAAAKCMTSYRFNKNYKDYSQSKC